MDLSSLDPRSFNAVDLLLVAVLLPEPWASPTAFLGIFLVVQGVLAALARRLARPFLRSAHHPVRAQAQSSAPCLASS